MAFKDKEQLTIFLTSQCNLACTYCYMPKMNIKKEEQFVDLEFVKQGLIDFFDNYSSRTIRFFSSGEPTMAFFLMKQIYEMAYQMVGDELKVELETNGFFNKVIAEWIRGHVDYLWISFDGPSSIQNVQRPTVSNQSSYELVVENIKGFISDNHLQLGVRATISDENLSRQVELIEFFHTLGIKFVAASPTYHSKVNPSVQTPSLLDFAKHFVPAFKRAKDLGMYYQTLIMVNFYEGSDIYCQASIPTPRLTTDGYVTSCDWASFGPTYLPDSVKQQLVYGKWDREAKRIIYDQSKIEKIKLRNSKYLSAHFCKACKYIPYCNGGCVGKMVAATNDLYQASEDWCKAVEYLYENLNIKEPLPFLHP